MAALDREGFLDGTSPAAMSQPALAGSSSATAVQGKERASQQARKQARQRARARLAPVLVPAAALGIVVVAWQFLVPVFGVGSYLLPTPTEIVSAVTSNFGELANAITTTATTAVIAFGLSVVVSFLAAITIAHSRILENATMPLLIMLWTAPTVAVAPIIVVWLGIGSVSVVVIAMVTCFFPIVTNIVSGMRSVTESTGDLFKVCGSSRWQRLWLLEVPSALPHMFAALKITAALAIVGTVSGEYVAGVGGGNGGLGYIIIVTGSRLETPYLYAASIISAAMGIIMYWIVSTLERVLLGSWHESARRNKPAY
jgi:NitT/TauT family transport system permease protein